MAARTPRRSFATPFVITLAAAPACYVQSTPAPSGPTTTTTTSSAPPTATTSTPDQPPAQGPAGPPTQGPGPVVVNPPMPQSQPPPSTAPGNTKWTVYKAADGCMAAFKVECQPRATCNPPPPFKYACPQNVSLDRAITVASNADGSACFVDYGPMNCPPNTACNPPRPTPVACPKR